jgi:hypothetical protein
MDYRFIWHNITEVFLVKKFWSFNHRLICSGSYRIPVLKNAVQIEEQG